jgi:putative iron-only hydrogenase system regulator
MAEKKFKSIKIDKPHLCISGDGDFFMPEQYHTITITVYDRNLAFPKVNALLHEHADRIQMRVGYPMPDQNVAVIFIITKMTTDILGSLTGKLGQIKSVKVKSTTLKI